MMQRINFAGAALLLAAATAAQTHVVKKPEAVVRAVAVYEWTGDEARPTASRLVPVSVFINNQFEDAGVYLARPVPFAIDRGTIFETQQAGKPKGTVEVAYERHVARSGGGETAPLDDGWVGYGAFKPLPKDPYVPAKAKGPVAQIEVSGGKRPRFADKPASKDGGVQADQPAPREEAGSARTDEASKKTGAEASADDKGPTMRRRTADPSSSTDSGDAADDVDRPTLKRRTPAEAKETKKKNEMASVKSTVDLNDDPDRPTLHRGVAAAAEIPALEGLPADLHQMVAISDAKDRSPHDFVRPWESASEQAEVLARMEDLTRSRLLSSGGKTSASLPSQSAPPSRASARAKRPTLAATPAPLVLRDESLKGYTLSYGGAPTFVYSATAGETSGATRYVTVVAQQEPGGELKPALSSVTDSTHLDRTPWMRLVDVVDAEASNRASLLFELRSDHQRQFALFRVIGARAEQVFTSGTTE